MYLVDFHAKAGACADILFTNFKDFSMEVEISYEGAKICGRNKYHNDLK